MHIDEHACMCLVHACRSANTRACASCSHAHRRARMHVPCARIHIGVHGCMCLMRACTSASTHACASCSHAQRHSCVQRHVHACTVESWLAVRCGCVHEHVRA